MAAPVVARSRAPFLTEVTAGPHHWILDEPREAGGTERGPTPYDMLAAALAGCTAMTLHFFDRLGSPPAAEPYRGAGFGSAAIKSAAASSTERLPST